MKGGCTSWFITQRCAGLLQSESDSFADRGSLSFGKHILYTSFAGLCIEYVAVPAITTRWRKRHVNN